MSRSDALISPSAIEYILAHSVRESGLLARLQAETAKLSNAIMQTPPEHGQLLRVLIKMIGARRTIEVGVFTGYSSLSVALALPEDGKILACDVSDEFTKTARRYWAEAGIASKIDLVLAPASETLAGRIAAGESGSYDFAFIDADKSNYRDYYEKCLTLLRPRGVIAIDNTLWDGKVWDLSVNDDDTRAIRALNDFIHKDERVDQLLLPIADGVTIAVKR
jgi:predicted O-methyltransferase YrrM